ncbi:hypothetical protein KXD93_00970 [Mucilaginibacter sp. BJC16-A38]|uniref:hypothetical protein n=1 Tax=Mucilaginibacter phenanthrenivorans TaxID=1234842 RepID=UPI002157A802|nr:hypothetical protein [Mucilaginibacter phenanthrenivorans]MCR8556190.1 hypothetical protein [Mucilaginibacter phenanthrenivorans]
MPQPLNNILVKVFARGFYKVNSGLLIFLFVILVSYCFFINTLGDVKLLPPGRELYYQFMILITFVSSPGMMLMFFTVWIFYTIKSWQYVSGQLQIEHHEFLYYSVLSAGRIQQFKGWFYMQFIISLPFVCYALLASVIGVVLHHYGMVMVIILFTILLITTTAFIYTKQLNALLEDTGQTWLINLGQSWRKPFFSLFVYHIFDRLKMALVLTKLLSYVAIISIMFSFADAVTNSRVASFAVLAIVMAHSILIYQQHRFALVYLSITRNFPYSLGKLYAQHVLTYLILLLPECIWLFINFKFFMAVGLLVMLLGITMLFHCVLYRIGLAMNKYLPWLLGIFFAISLVILFGLVWWLVPVCFGVSYCLFYVNYYKEELDEG